METETLQLTERQERLLIHEDRSSMNQIVEEAEGRAAILNSLQPLSKEEIENITASPHTIDAYIKKLHLAQNPEYARLHNAGIKVEAALPSDLANLTANLKAWHNYPTTTRGGNKFTTLVFDFIWRIDEAGLENFFIKNRLKIFVSGEKLLEYKEFLQMCDILEKGRCPNNQIAQNSWFNERIECLGTHKFKPKWQWFNRERN